MERRKAYYCESPSPARAHRSDTRVRFPPAPFREELMKKNRILLWTLIALAVLNELTVLLVAGKWLYAAVSAGIALYAGSVAAAVWILRKKTGYVDPESVQASAMQEKKEPPALRHDFEGHGTALLIDADNVDPVLLPHIMKNIGLVGEATLLFSALYGNAPSFASWEGAIMRYGFEKRFSDRYVPGKNSTDFRIVMDCMDLMRDMPELDTFVIVSSDSDFSSIAARLRSARKTVIGMGEEHAPQIFRDSCSRFVDLSEAQWRDFLTRRILKLMKDNGGMVSASVAANAVRTTHDFKDLGYTTFGHLVRDLGFDMQDGMISGGPVSNVTVEVREATES